MTKDELLGACLEAVGWKHHIEPSHVAGRSHDWWEPPNGTPVERCMYYSSNLDDAITLLSGYSWSLHTCDMGYRCSIHTAPERGDNLIGDAVADTPAEAVCLAFLEAKKNHGKG